jgi:copper homeostasis protein
VELLREFCAENLTLVPAAVAAGARRIELCDNLAVGGTSPSYGVIKAAVGFARDNNVQVMAMVRPRSGGFDYNKREQAMMLDDIACARALGVDGVVFGCVRTDANGRAALDAELVKVLVDAAKGERSEDAPLQVTFHMAFDVLGNDAQFKAIDELASLGVERILTHGGPAGTPILDNVERLRGLVAYASDRLIILPGGGITWQNADQVASLIGVHEVHGTKVVRF